MTPAMPGGLWPWMRATALACVVLAWAGAGGSTFAQAAATSTPPTIGFVGGLSSAKIIISGEGATIAFDSRTGVTAGMSLTKRLDEALSVEADGLYVQQGFRASSGGETAQLSIDYLQFPLLLRYGLGSSSTPPFVTGGVALAYKAKCTGAISGSGASLAEGCGQGVKDFDYGLVIGGGISSGPLSGSVRYFWGQANVVDDPDASVRNRVLMVMAEYRLGGE